MVNYTSKEANREVRQMLENHEKWTPNYGDPLGVDEKIMEFCYLPVVLDLEEGLIKINGQEYKMDDTTKQMAQNAFKKSEKRTLIALAVVVAGLLALCAVQGVRKSNKQKVPNTTETTIKLKGFDNQRRAVAQFYSTKNPTK